MDYLVTTFYKFTSLGEKQLAHSKQDLEKHAHDLSLFGLVLLAPEGINATIAGSVEAVTAYKQLISDRFGMMRYQDSSSDRPPFKRFKVKIKPEIVQLKRTDLRPNGSQVHLSPQEWNRATEQENMIMIDVRNWYETKLGTFKNAINPRTWTFSQFPAWLQKSGIAKDANIGIFCTGGIRCEKAAVAMKEQGYENVSQLDGGILHYLQVSPNQNFAGECFIFDHRIALSQDLRPSTIYSLCPQCGNGGSIDQTCAYCAASYKICEECLAKSAVVFCSKDCRFKHSRRQ